MPLTAGSLRIARLSALILLTTTLWTITGCTSSSDGSSPREAAVEPTASFRNVEPSAVCEMYVVEASKLPDGETLEAVFHLALEECGTADALATALKEHPRAAEFTEMTDSDVVSTIKNVCLGYPYRPSGKPAICDDERLNRR